MICWGKSDSQNRNSIWFHEKNRKLSTRIYFSCFLIYVCGFQSVCHKSGDSSHFCHFCLFLLVFTYFFLFLLISTCFYLFLLDFYLFLLIHLIHFYQFNLFLTCFFISTYITFYLTWTSSDILILVLTSWISASK